MGVLFKRVELNFLAFLKPLLIFYYDINIILLLKNSLFAWLNYDQEQWCIKNFSYRSYYYIKEKEVEFFFIKGFPFDFPFLKSVSSHLHYSLLSFISLFFLVICMKIMVDVTHHGHIYLISFEGLILFFASCGRSSH